MQLIAGKGLMKKPDAKQAWLLLVQLHMLRKPTQGSRWWQHSHATLIRPARFLVFYKHHWNLLFMASAKHSAQSSAGDPLLCWQGFVLCSSSIRGGWTMMLEVYPKSPRLGHLAVKSFWFCHKLVSEKWQASFQKILISILPLSPAMLISQTNWRALTDIFFNI